MCEESESEEHDVGGYEAEFDPPLEHDHSCCICFLAFREPMQLDCGHQYCRSCLDKYRGTDCEGEFVCPVDREVVDINRIFPDKAMQRKVLSLMVKCNNINNSCNWTGELRELERHMKVCQFIYIECPSQGCSTKLLKFDLDDHLLYDCQFRQVECQYCKENYIYVDEENHNDTCNYFPIDCTNGCGDKNVPRQEMDSHLKICPLSTLPCDYAKLGCVFMGSFNQRDVHEKDQMKEHLKMAIVRIHQLEENFHQASDVFDKIKTFEHMYESTKQTLEKMSKLESEVPILKEKNSYLEVRMREYEKLTPRIIKPPILAERALLLSPPIEKLYKEMENLQYGIYVWTIQDYQTKLEEAQQTNNRLCSEQFLTSQFGYTLRLVVYLNGWGTGKGTHLGLCIQVGKGRHDDSLSWPFKRKISLFILHHTDESKHKGKTLSPKPKDREEVNASFVRPVSGYNSPNGWGDVISHGNVASKGFLLNDTIHVMCRISD